MGDFLLSPQKFAIKLEKGMAVVEERQLIIPLIQRGKHIEINSSIVGQNIKLFTIIPFAKSPPPLATGIESS